MRYVVFSFLLCLSAMAIADRIVIAGKPTELIVHDGYFSLPDSYVQRGNYHFIHISNTDRICYLQEKPMLEGLPKLYINIEEDNLKIRWICYLYDPSYFEIDY